MQDNFLTLIDGKRSLRPKTEQYNFSVKKIGVGEVVEVSDFQQMFVNGAIIVDGQLNVFGEIVFLDLEDSDTEQVIPPADPENFSHDRVVAGDTKIIPAWQQMNLYGQIEVFGQLNILGSVNLTQIYQEQTDPEEFIHEENFSYKNIVSGASVKVRTNEQMIVVGDLLISGQLNLLGEVALISAAIDDNFEDDFLPPYKIESNELFKIGTNKIMFLPRSLVNLGQLNLFGELALGGL